MELDPVLLSHRQVAFVADSFSQFVTLNGFIFEVWKGQNWVGGPLWWGSYIYYHGPEGEYSE